MNKNLDFLKNIVIAHRGYHDNKNKIPENSILAFKKAILNNYAIELDIHLLKDGSVVVFHDDNLKRMTGLDKDIKDMSYDEINKLFLLDTDEKIPLFNDVLDFIDGKVLLIVEFKYDLKAGMLEEAAMKILDNYNGKFVVKSFSPLSILWFKKNYPNVIRGQLTTGTKNKNVSWFKNKLIDKMFLNIITKPDFISRDVRNIDEKRIIKLKKNKPILCWTIKNKNDYDKALAYADSFICENMDDYL